MELSEVVCSTLFMRNKIIYSNLNDNKQCNKRSWCVGQ